MMKIMPQLVYLGAWQKTSEKIINDKIAGKKIYWNSRGPRGT